MDTPLKQPRLCGRLCAMISPTWLSIGTKPASVRPLFPCKEMRQEEKNTNSACRSLGGSERLLFLYHRSATSRSGRRQHVRSSSRLVLFLLRLASTPNSVLPAVLLDRIVYIGQFWRRSFRKRRQYPSGKHSHLRSGCWLRRYHFPTMLGACARQSHGSDRLISFGV